MRMEWNPRAGKTLFCLILGRGRSRTGVVDPLPSGAVSPIACGLPIPLETTLPTGPRPAEDC
jgi:hypothetical protein